MEKRVRVAGIIPIENGFAFMHRTNVKNRSVSDYYTFPGGGKEENETFEEGVKREIKEELGIDVEVKQLLYEKTNYDGNQRNQKEYFYLCKYVKGEFGTGDGPEFSNDPKYVDSGKYIPEIISREKVEKITLFPPEIREKFIKDLRKSRY